MKSRGVLLIKSPQCYKHSFRQPFGCRLFATQHALRAAPPSSSEAADKFARILDLPLKQSSTPQTEESNSSSPSPRISDLLQDVRQPRRESPQNNRTSKGQNEKVTDGFADLLKAAMEMDKGKHAALRQGNILRGMTSMSQDVLEIAKRQQVGSLAPPLRLDAFIGRCEQVGSLGLSRAFQRLDMKLRQNNVRGDEAYQRFYERPGLKRKRLKSQRWRKRFKEGFKAALTKVQKMRRQGW